MKKTETTHLKASQVEGMDRRSGSATAVVGQGGESLRELKASEKAEMGRRRGSAVDRRRGSKVWIGLGIR